MIQIAKKFEVDGELFIKVLIENCCKSLYLFRVDDGCFFDMNKMEYASIGMTDSLKKALALHDSQ